HDGITPRPALDIQQLVIDAGPPQGAYNDVCASHDQVAAMIADPRTQGVSLTGSERAGATIGAQASKNLKKSVLEFGGSDLYIVLDTKRSEERRVGKEWRSRM